VPVALLPQPQAATAAMQEKVSSLVRRMVTSATKGPRQPGTRGARTRATPRGAILGPH
jgi:hypothetical protein